MKKIMFCLAAIGTVGNASCMSFSNVDLPGTIKAAGRACAVAGGAVIKGGAKVVEVGADAWKTRPDALKNTGIIKSAKDFGGKLIDRGLQ